MSNTVQKIKERLGIIEVISSYITVEKSGANFKAKCPFHHEKTPSFFISPERQSYYCFGCGVKGDIFTFVQEFEGLDFLSTLKMLADRAHVEIERFERVENNTKDLYGIMLEATQFFQNNLKNAPEALAYLKNRKLSIEMVRDWKIGYAQNDWRSLKTYLAGKGWSEQDMLDAGLIKQNEKGESYDRFRDRVMFPIFDTLGRVIAFSGRILHAKDEEPKYLNSPDTELFDKSKTLYGYHVAKSTIRQNQYAVLVEGQMDLLMSHQAGVSNTVASSGTALTESHLEIIKRLADTIVIAYDADNAGRSATMRAWKLALAKGLHTKIAYLPDGLDPADAIAKDPTLWTNAVANAVNIIDYFIESIKDVSDTSIVDKTLKEKILPLIKSVSSAIDRSRFLQKVSFVTGIGEKALTEELSKIKDEEIKSIELPKKHESRKIHKALKFYIYLQSKNHEYLD